MDEKTQQLIEALATKMGTTAEHRMLTALN